MTARAILTTGYRSQVFVEQTDSIVLALPDGGEQTQMLRRRLLFGVIIDHTLKDFYGCFGLPFLFIEFRQAVSGFKIFGIML